MASRPPTIPAARSRIARRGASAARASEVRSKGVVRPLTGNAPKKIDAERLAASAPTPAAAMAWVRSAQRSASREAPKIDAATTAGIKSVTYCKAMHVEPVDVPRQQHSEWRHHPEHKRPSPDHERQTRGHKQRQYVVQRIAPDNLPPKRPRVQHGRERNLHRRASQVLQTPEERPLQKSRPSHHQREAQHARAGRCQPRIAREPGETPLGRWVARSLRPGPARAPFQRRQRHAQAEQNDKHALLDRAGQHGDH